MEKLQVIIALINVPIAALLAFVAWQNYKISHASFYIQKDKLRLELFEKRLQIFEACQKLFSSVTIEGRATSAMLSPFLRDSANAEFLFGKEIAEYVDEVHEKILRLFQVNKRLDDESLPVGEKRTELANEAEKLQMWFDEQFERSRKIFRKYLHFSIDKTP